MALSDLPAYAAWQHLQVRTGFEVVFLAPVAGGGYCAEGGSTAVEDDEGWTVRYAIEVGADGLTQRARVSNISATGRHQMTLEAVRPGRWTIDGKPLHQLDGCFDIDLECSALTNALPVHRLGLRVGEHAEAPAAFVRATDLRVERLEQQYTRLDHREIGQRYRYVAQRFDVDCDLAYDSSGLILDYPGLAARVA
jgi:hypothetical protein